MKKLFLLVLIAASNVGLLSGQSTRQAVMETVIYGISSSWHGECAAGVVDNRSAASRQNYYHAIGLASGSGTWSASMNYSDVSCAGPWTSFGIASQITQASSPPVAYGNGNHLFVQIVITGNAIVTYTAMKTPFLSTAVGSVSFPITLGQGGTGATTAAAGLANLLNGNAQGTYTNKVQMAGTVSGSAGSALCTDGSGNDTTVGCSPQFPAGSQTQFLQLAPNTGNSTTVRFTNLPTVQASDYNFTPQTPGGSLSPGSNTISMSTCPLGVNGTDSNHYLYILGGTGTAEPGLITGGSCVALSPGTVIVNVANSHSGAWTIGSATGGAQEAIIAQSSPGHLIIPAATTFHAPLYIPPPTGGLNYYGQNWTIEGAGQETGFINVASDFPLSASGVIIAGYTPCPGNVCSGGWFPSQSGQMYGPVLKNFHMVFSQVYTGRANLIHFPPAIYANGVSYGKVSNVTIEGAWDGIVAKSVYQNGGDNPSASGWSFDQIDMAAYDVGFQLDGSFDITRIHALHFYPFGSPTGAAYMMMFDPACIGMIVGRMDGLDLSDSFFISGTAINFTVGADGGIVNWGTVTNTSFDVFGTINFTDGNVAFDNVNFSLDQYPGGGSVTCNSTSGLQYSAGQLSITNASFNRFCTTGSSITIAPTGIDSTDSRAAQVTIANSKIQDQTNFSTVPPLIQLVGNNASATNQTVITGNNFVYAYNLTYANPAVSLTSASSTGLHLVFTDNTTSDLAFGSSVTLLSVGYDDLHEVHSNSCGAHWSISLPAATLKGSYETCTNSYTRPPSLVKAVVGGSPYSLNRNSGNVQCNAAGGTVQINLPFASSAAIGATFTIVKTDSSANACWVVPGVTDYINTGAVGYLLQLLVQSSSVTLTSDGVNHWYGSPINVGTVTTSGSPVSGNMAAFSAATTLRPALYTDIVPLWASGSCSGYLKSDGTCSVSGGMVWPGAAGVANFNGTNWGTSYTVGIAANNLVQLTAGAALPGVSGVNLTGVGLLAGNNTYTGSNTFGGATHTTPMVVVANVGSLPATCAVGEEAFNYGVTAGTNIYGCTATNTWTQIAGGGGGATTDLREFKCLSQLGVGGCNFDLIAGTNQAQFNAHAGLSNTAFGTVDFLGAATGTQAAVIFHTQLPNSWTSVVFDLAWLTSATTGAAGWNLQLACVAATGASLDPAWDTARPYTSTAQGTANYSNAITPQTLTLPGSCVSGTPGPMLFGRIYRNGSDTLGASATASLVSARLTIVHP